MKWGLTKWLSDMISFFSFVWIATLWELLTAPHARALTQCHMSKSKSQETHRVGCSCIKTFYPPAAYSPPKRNTFSNHFKMCISCKFNSNRNKSLANYNWFTSINAMSIKCPCRLQLFISCIGAKCCRGCLCEYWYWGYWYDRCRSFALPVIIPHDCQQIVLSATDMSEINFGDILLQPLSTPLAQSINWATTSLDGKDDFNILRLKSPSTSAGSTPDWDVLWLDMSPDEGLI